MIVQLRTLVVSNIACALLTLAGCTEQADVVDETMVLIEEWLLDGTYDTSAQAAADEAANIPDNLKHRLVYQVFHRIEVDWLDGLTYFQQGSSDGTPATTARAGIVEFFPDREEGIVRMREHNFKEVEGWVDAYLSPEKIASISADDVKFDEGCDFFLIVNEERTEIGGPMRDGACRLPEEQFGMELIAEDAVVIRPGELWFWGRFVDAEGVVMWGTESDELNKLVLQR